MNELIAFAISYVIVILSVTAVAVSRIRQVAARQHNCIHLGRFGHADLTTQDRN